MKGFVPTPVAIVRLMVEKLLAGISIRRDLRVLDPGCGDGEFIAGIVEFCASRRVPLPRIVGIELDPGRAQTARERFAALPEIEIREADFLRPSTEQFDLVIGNPPYVSILDLDTAEREYYRSAYSTARGRFDLYLLFFEQSLRMLKPGARLVFITPEKFLYVDSARPLRDLLLKRHVRELHFAGESTFGHLVTYPLITTVSAGLELTPTTVLRRDGSHASVRLDSPASWLPVVSGHTSRPRGVVLSDVALRVSCGVATGADHAYVLRRDEVPPALFPFAHPTVSGRQITLGRPIKTDHVILAPYDREGRLLPESSLGALGRYLNEPARRDLLDRRTCTARKKWFAYHDNLPLGAMLRPKLLCKDITETPFFVVDRQGTIVPRHSVYYVVPADAEDLIPLASYLNSDEAAEWMRAHCQRAAKGFLRLQSNVLKELPLPSTFVPRSGALTIADDQLEALPA
jgi:SAM-dependent methyltransferase